MKITNTDLIEKILLINDKILKFSSKNIFENTEMTTIQFNILGEIILGKGLLVSQIKEKLIVSSPAISQILNRMEKSGLIEREISKENRREINVKPTEKGIFLYKELNEKYIALSNEKLSFLTEEERENTIKILEKIENVVSI